MKKVPLLLLVLAMLLSACGKESEPIPETTVPPAQSLYQAASEAESATGGAVRQYQLERSDYAAMYPMGEKLLLVSEDRRTLTVFQPDPGTIAAQVTLDTEILPESPTFAVSPTGISYFKENTHEVIFCNPNLQQSAAAALPGDSSGEPAVSLQKNEVYYFEEGQLRALHVTEGISRLVADSHDTAAQITASYFDGAVLLCSVDGEPSFYIETETGRKTTKPGEFAREIYTWQDRFFALYPAGGVSMQLYGARSEDAIWHLTAEGGVAPVLNLGGAVQAVSGEESLELKFYELETGICTSRVQIPGKQASVSTAAANGDVWVLAEVSSGIQRLYQWETEKTPAREEGVYREPFYTAVHPDREGLKACREQADTLEKNYGVRIYFADEAAKKTDASFAVQEYQVGNVEEMLSRLSAALESFPKVLLEEGSKIYHIGLVRSLSSGKQTDAYFDDNRFWIFLTGEGDLSKNLIRGAAKAVDAMVLGNSRDYDTWEQLNPPGFSYVRGEPTAYSGEHPELTGGETRYFANANAMRSLTDDRIELFCLAMDPEAGEIFSQAEGMEKKLLRMCEGIREAYKLEEEPETYLWEQHLNQSLAYREED